MKNVTRSKKARPLPCIFCGSSRVRLAGCADDRGEAAFIRCDRCETEGPHVRGAIGDDDRVTPEMAREAAELWNSTFLDKPRARRRVGAKAAEVKEAPARAAGEVAAEYAVTPAPTTNGHNGHHAGAL